MARIAEHRALRDEAAAELDAARAELAAERRPREYDDGFGWDALGRQEMAELDGTGPGREPPPPPPARQNATRVDEQPNGMYQVTSGGIIRTAGTRTDARALAEERRRREPPAPDTLAEVAALLTRPEGCQSADVAAVLGSSTWTARDHLASLMAAGAARKDGLGRWTRYYATDAPLPDTRSDLDGPASAGKSPVSRPEPQPSPPPDPPEPAGKSDESPKPRRCRCGCGYIRGTIGYNTAHGET